MSQVTEVQQTIARQFNACGRRVLRNGHARFAAATHAYPDGITVSFQFRAARKRRGAFIADQTTIVVTYDAGADLYNVTVKAFDGVTHESTTTRTIDGLDAESLANVDA